MTNRSKLLNYIPGTTVLTVGALSGVAFAFLAGGSIGIPSGETWKYVAPGMVAGMVLAALLQAVMVKLVLEPALVGLEKAADRMDPGGSSNYELP